MKPLELGRYALGTSVAAALLAACSGSQPPVGAPGEIPQASAHAPSTSSTNYRVLYSFGGPPDGLLPQASLIDAGGTLYGTTSQGGTSSCAYLNGCGTIFSITTGGTEKVLYSFGHRPDGFVPVASLLDVDGTFYGTTSEGGSSPCYYYAPLTCGTVFSVTKSGKEKVLHSFGSGSDGAGPNAPLIEMKGTLYGTTTGGGGNLCGSTSEPEECGTIFSITPSGTEKVLHAFSSDPDGAVPVASLGDVKGTLYGTTEYGGTYRRCAGSRCGTIFSITPSGTEKVLHSFGKGKDGEMPVAGLIEVSGTLYGTTRCGGAYGHGTVFSITRSGRERVIFSFGNGTDGRGPGAGLIDVKGTLYGTTVHGGTYSCGSHDYGCGTLFSVTTSGAEEVLHNFGNGADGSAPEASLIDVKGTLYGTTNQGGTHGDGTVFALTP